MTKMKFSSLFIIFLFTLTVQAQTIKRDFDLKVNGEIEITNFYGRVNVSAEETQEVKVSILAQSKNSLAETELKTSAANGKIKVEVTPKDEKIRVDLDIKIPLRSRVYVETRAGEVRSGGSFDIDHGRSSYSAEWFRP